MAIGDSNIGLLFRMKGDSSDAVRAMRETEAEAEKLKGTTGGLGGTFDALSGATAIAAAGIIAVAAAATSAALAVFDLSRNAAAYGSEIFNASVKTGLSTETISALKLASERTGVSMESLGTIVSRFSRLVGEAEQGSDKAAQTLTRLGITPQEAISDLDGALGKVFLKIQNLPDPISKATLAQQAFGKAGTELLKVIDDFDGDLTGAIAKARELGLVMSEEDARAADEFGDILDTVNAQLRGVGIAIGNEFMPIFLEMARFVSGWLKDNKAEVKGWAESSVNFLRGFADICRVTAESVRQLADGTHRLSGTMTSLIGAFVKNDPILRAVVALWERWANAVKLVAERGQSITPVRAEVSVGGLISDPNTFRDFDAEEGEQKKAEREREKARREAERIAERDLAAQIRIESINLRTIQEGMVENYEKMRKALGEGQSIASFIKLNTDATKFWNDRLRTSLTTIEELEKRQLDSTATANEHAALTAQQQERRKSIEKAGNAEIAKNEKELHEERKDRFQERIDWAAFEADLARAHFNLAMEREEERRQALGLDATPDIGAPPLINPEDPGNESGIGGLGDLLEGLFDDDLTDGISLYTGLVDTLKESFSQLANAVGQSVRAFVLFGGAGTSFRKFAAELLASIAQMAAIQAVWNLAEGFAKLALAYFGHPTAGASATQHFIAAAVYGTIAGVAALAGRAVAGDSFKQQTANGGAGASTSSGNRDVSAQGQAYSGHGDDPTVVESGRNSPGIAVKVKVDDDSHWLGKMLTFEIEHNSGVRAEIRRLAEA